MLSELLDPCYAAQVAKHATASEVPALSAADSLATAITMEGLLFAAFAVGTNLTGATKEGRSPFFTQAWFGWCIVAVIALVALAAGSIWWELFGAKCPKNLGELFLEVGLALGILMQPIFAAVINVESKKTAA